MISTILAFVDRTFDSWSYLFISMICCIKLMSHSTSSSWLILTSCKFSWSDLVIGAANNPSLDRWDNGSVVWLIYSKTTAFQLWWWLQIVTLWLAACIMWLKQFNRSTFRWAISVSQSNSYPIKASLNAALSPCNDWSFVSFFLIAGQASLAHLQYAVDGLDWLLAWTRCWWVAHCIITCMRLLLSDMLSCWTRIYTDERKSCNTPIHGSFGLVRIKWFLRDHDLSSREVGFIAVPIFLMCHN